MKGPLGKKVAAPKKFDPKVLFPISRTEQRKGVFCKTDISTIMGDDVWNIHELLWICLLYTSPSPRDGLLSRMPSSA